MNTVRRFWVFCFAFFFFLRKVTTTQTCVANHMWFVRPEPLHRVNMFFKNGNILALQPACQGCSWDRLQLPCNPNKDKWKEGWIENIKFITNLFLFYMHSSVYTLYTYTVYTLKQNKCHKDLYTRNALLLKISLKLA